MAERQFVLDGYGGTDVRGGYRLFSFRAGLNDAAERSHLLFRAILMRNHGRDRDMEVNAIFPTMQYPDPYGETVDWDDWNDLVDMYYDSRGWDRKIGWPYRETWEKYGLKDIADELEKLGKLPKRSAVTK
ncbi:Aldehyde ferredoxin oxidoreductase, domain 3 [Syntrophaceticus schinkii]|uniref:Aldehyde ferredoxin oxidoreductase, domain 3 n=1 Tax=Syntrophaceticus schinkii TaxID=499207 RepID=A0A0B7MEL1_9FIRM|nr:aldehyde ferredoxin oxidoreductase C-terminal domain-containing protein [Syntrophaceticus schinkii]CEO88505.1 Aldehyde ferredoxin oxidoreductase, domain 3 [Syntrophaceticus schinkii]